MNKLCKTALFAICLFMLLAGCSSKVGSDAWCKKMQEKPKGEWTANEASDFAKHCVFKLDKE